MKRLAIVSLLLVLAMIVVCGSAYGAGGGQLNGQEGVVEEGVRETDDVLSVWIKNAAGTTVTNVKRSNPWTYAVRGYWVGFGGGTAWTDATITINLNLTGLPEKTIAFQYHLASAYSGNTVTPFAITDWGGAATTGYGRVTVVTHGGGTTSLATMTFTISPY